MPEGVQDLRRCLEELNHPALGVNFDSAKLFSALVKNRGADVLIGWQHYWLIPCIAAAIIMAFFAVLFRNPEQGTTSN